MKKTKLYWNVDVKYSEALPTPNSPPITACHRNMTPSMMRSLVKKLEAQEAYFNTLKIEFAGSLTKEESK